MSIPVEGPAVAIIGGEHVVVLERAFAPGAGGACPALFSRRR
jgi:hypothetical protein